MTISVIHCLFHGLPFSTPQGSLVVSYISLGTILISCEIKERVPASMKSQNIRKISPSTFLKFVILEMHSLVTTPLY